MSVSDLLTLDGPVEVWRSVWGGSDLCLAVPVEATLRSIITRETGAMGGVGWGGADRLINQFSVTFREARVCE